MERVGEGGVPFKIYKFRSMVQNAHALKSELLRRNERRGPLFKMKDDPRITLLGKFLRRWSLDEVPNFYNVLIGTMSLVGPRPHEPDEVKAYSEYQRKLLNIKPGITGLAQISGRSNLSFEEEARLDIFYVENWSLKMDFAIMLKTPGAVFFRREGAM
jgi:lipopolysaccharide/colanic/teichoic acid biosynthesis glycosyltransferase